MSLSNTERLAIALECHDPAGDQVMITETEILNHLLVVGSTGAGKTTRVMLPALDDLCRGFNGLLLIDEKGDADYLEGVRESTRRHGRTLIEVDGSGKLGLNLFQPMRSRGSEGVEEVGERLCSALPVAETNRYWDIVFGKIVRGALGMLVYYKPRFSYDEAVDWLERYLLLFDRGDEEIGMAEETLRDALESSADPDERRRIQGILRMHGMWATLDSRTRSNHQSMASTVVSSLSRDVARKYFAAECSVDLAKELDEGNVVFLSVDGFGERELAGLLACLLKAWFYRGLFTRKSDAMPWGLLLDDWSISVSGGIGSDCSDAAALSHIRSKRGFVIAACQSLSDIDARIGRLEREAAVANFGTLVFMRSRDLETDLLAQRSFVVPDREITESWRMGSVSSQAWNTVRRFEGSLLPIGKLSRLDTGEAYVSVCGKIKEQAVLLSPYWEIKGKWEGGDHAAK